MLRRTASATAWPSSATPPFSSSTRWGYLPLDQVATSFLFQLVSQRYTKGSIIVTSNKSYGEWGGVFGDEVAAAAILDRLLHHSTTVNIPARATGSRTRGEQGSSPSRAPKAASSGACAPLVPFLLHAIAGSVRLRRLRQGIGRFTTGRTFNHVPTS